MLVGWSRNAQLLRWACPAGEKKKESTSYKYYLIPELNVCKAVELDLANFHWLINTILAQSSMLISNFRRSSKLCRMAPLHSTIYLSLLLILIDLFLSQSNNKPSIKSNFPSNLTCGWPRSHSSHEKRHLPQTLKTEKVPLLPPAPSAGRRTCAPAGPAGSWGAGRCSSGPRRPGGGTAGGRAPRARRPPRGSSLNVWRQMSRFVVQRQ